MVIVSTVLVVGVTGLRANSADAPEGKPETLKVTGEVNPLVAVNCVVNVMA